MSNNRCAQSNLRQLAVLSFLPSFPQNGHFAFERGLFGADFAPLCFDVCSDIIFCLCTQSARLSFCSPGKVREDGMVRNERGRGE